MTISAEKIDQALRAQGLREYVDAIDDNPATPGEVVIWCGMGHPVTTIERAVAIARQSKLERDLP